MSRSSRWRSGRHAGSKSSAPTPRRPPTVPGVAGVHAVVGGGRLSEGLVLEASIVARLLGLRLLTLDAGVIVTPARLSSRSPRAGVVLSEARRALDEGAAALAAGRAPSGSLTPSRQV